MGFIISEDIIYPEKEKKLVLDASSGGFVSFEGWVRNHNEGYAVSGLSYEAYPELCVSEGMNIIEEALEKFPVERVRAVHRYGDLNIGDIAVWIGVSSHHRAEAFQACQYLINHIKDRVPIWKKEHYVDRESQWVMQCKGCLHAHQH